MKDLKISVSGIRGVVGASFTPRLIINFAEAFATYMGRGKIAVATDTRPSRHMVKHAVFAGLLSAGAEPVDAGILPIPSFQVFVDSIKARGGVAITASHNPVEWNALKLIKKGGFYLFSYEAEELLDLYHQELFSRRRPGPSSVEKEEKAFDFHLKRLLDFADLSLLRQAKLKVVVDACNGAASPYVARFLEALGCRVEVINADVEKPFPRPPEPLPENLAQLSRKVKEVGADVGFAQDADADRLAAVDEEGKPIGEEYTLALAVRYFLKYRASSDVVVNLSTSSVMEDVAKEAGVRLVRTKVGEINVVEEMLKRKARIGGEGNGGIIATDVHPCRDSFSGMVLILSYLARSRKSLSRLRAELPSYHMIKGKVEISFRERLKIMDHFRRKWAGKKLDTRDGLRFEEEDYWCHLRPSNTEPVIRIIVEAKSAERAEAVYKEILDEIKELKEV